MKVYENIFTIRVWWALIEVAPHAVEIEMACYGEKEVACCVRGYHVYKDIWAAATVLPKCRILSEYYGFCRSTLLGRTDDSKATQNFG